MLDRPPFVVFGASKSGTTWLQRICNAHPDVRCHFQLPIFPLKPGTLNHPGPVVHNDERSPFAGVFQTDGDEQQYQWQLDFLTRTSLLRRDYVDRVICPHSAEQRKFADGLHVRMARALASELLCDAPDKRVFGTKSHLDLDLLFRVFPRAKVVHIVRDGRDVCVSKRFHSLRMGVFYLGDERSRLHHLINRWRPSQVALTQLGRRLRISSPAWFRKPGEDAPLFTTVGLTKFATEWKNTITYVRQHTASVPNQCLTLRYEELRAAPQQHLSRLFEYLEVDTSLATIDRIVAHTSFSKQKKKKNNSFFRGGRAGDWQRYFRPQDAQLFNKIAGDLLIDLGYQNDVDWAAHVAGPTVSRESRR